MRRSYLIILIIAAATIACLIPPGVASRSRNELLFTVWGMPFEDSLFRDGYARDFEAKNPGVTVHYETYPDVTKKYFVWHLRGFGADVMRLPITDYHAMVSIGALEPLDPYINDLGIGLSPAEQADFMPSLWDALEIDGRRYAIPSDNAQYGLYYNKTIFDTYNAEHPDERIEYPDASWTWEDLKEAGEKLTIEDERGEVIQYGVDFDLWAWPFMAFFAQAGGELWDEQQTTTLINSPEGLETLQFIVDLLPHAGPLRSADLKDSATGPDKFFVTGQTAILLDGSWRAPFLELINPDLDFAVAPLPHHRERAVVSGSVLWAISVHSRNKELAWKMVKFITNFEQSMRYWDALRVAPPSRLSVVRDEAFRSTRGIIDERGVVRSPAMPRDRWEDRGQWLLYATTPDPATGQMPGFVPVTPYQKDLEDKLKTMLGRAVSPHRKQPLADLLDSTVAEVHRIIDRDRLARGLPAAPREDTGR
jgi:multiple sugar transport system substrate-binding protein